MLRVSPDMVTLEKRQMRCAVLCYAVLCYAVLCYAMLCDAMQSCLPGFAKLELFSSSCRSEDFDSRGQVEVGLVHVHRRSWCHETWRPCLSRTSCSENSRHKSVTSETSRASCSREGLATHLEGEGGGGSRGGGKALAPRRGGDSAKGEHGGSDGRGEDAAKGKVCCCC